jgi:uncharacterized glyoxalase superfamily protein PhnB
MMFDIQYRRADFRGEKMTSVTDMDGLTPMLMCKDVQAAITFYTDVLGFTVNGRMDNIGTSGWAALQNGPVTIMLASPSYIPQAEQTDGRFTQSTYYYYVKDVVGLRTRVRVKGYETSELMVRFYGLKEFEMLDPEGHMMTFGQETDEPPTPE